MTCNIDPVIPAKSIYLVFLFTFNKLLKEKIIKLAKIEKEAI